MLWFKKKKKGPPGHRTNFQKSIDQNQSFFFPGLITFLLNMMNAKKINLKYSFEGIYQLQVVSVYHS